MTDIGVINWARDYIKHGGEYTDEQFDRFVEASEQLSTEYPTNGDYTSPGSAIMFDTLVAVTYDTIFGDKTPAELDAEVKRSVEPPLVVAAMRKQIRRVAGTPDGKDHAQRSIDELHRLQVAARERTDSLNQPTPPTRPMYATVTVTALVDSPAAYEDAAEDTLRQILVTFFARGAENNAVSVVREDGDICRASKIAVHTVGDAFGPQGPLVVRTTDLWSEA